VFSERINLLFMAILLSVATAANAAPTATDGIITPAVQVTLDTPAVIVPTNEAVEPITKLANLGKEFLQPPANFAGLDDTRGNNVKFLPAVPAAVLMALSGFLCVSLVRDRRVWLAALTGLLWAGQTGIQALPQLALRLSCGNHSQQQYSAELAYPYYLKNSNRLRSDIEGTQYIGLLRHLAGIPDAKTRYLHKYTYSSTSHPAIVLARSGLSPLIACLAPKVEQCVCFSPAFIFANLARGPPILA
jgi:hypothetical protein